ncbi:BlaI/MecI/CopY family transcriptional regulator, partial [uncultured Muribaculum sp.]
SRLEGNNYIYRPAIDEQDYKRTFLGNVVGSYFKNSYKELVTFFARDNKISSDELREIIDLINKGEEDK